MKGSGSVTLAMLAMIIMALVMVHPSKSKSSCGELANMLLPCVGYLTSGGSPSANCCSGVMSVQGAIQNQEDRRTACNCAKNAVGMLQVRADAVTDLPSKCGVTSTIPTDPNVDCNTIP